MYTQICTHWRMNTHTHTYTVNTNLYTHAPLAVILLPRERGRKMTIYLLWALGLRQHSLPVPEKRNKESKSETEEGVGRQKVGEQQKRTEGGAVDEQEKNEPEGATGWERGREFAGGWGVASCGLVRCSVWLCYSLAVACVGWAERSRETNSGKKVAEFTLRTL